MTGTEKPYSTLSNVRTYGTLYLRGHFSRQDLENALLSLSDYIDASGDSAAIKLTNRLQAGLIQIGEQLLTEDAFRKMLAGLLNEIDPVCFSLEHPTLKHLKPLLYTSSSSRDIQGTFERLSCATDYQFNLIL